MKCTKCDKEAEYNSPDDLCKEHWIRWWTDNDPNDSVQLSPEEVEAFYQEVVELLKEHSNKTKK